MRSVVTWAPARLATARFVGVADVVAAMAAAPDWPSCDDLNAWFAEPFASVGVRMVAADKMRATLRPDGLLDPQSLYEVRISDTGEVPTRPRNLHDLLNALMWAAFPLSKMALTRRLGLLQRLRAAGQAKLPVARTRPHDRLALIDEGGVLHLSNAANPTAPCTWIFGHAILEHAYAGIYDVRGAVMQLRTAASLRPPPTASARAIVDQILASIVGDDEAVATAMVAGAGQPIDDAQLARAEAPTCRPACPS